jgi:hypothetical protein
MCRRCYLRPLPADFAEQAASMRAAALGRHYKAAETTVARWYRDSGVPPPPRQVPIPKDLAEQAAKMGVMQLARHYGRGDRLVRRWLKDAGLKALASPPRPRSDYKPREKPARSQPFIWKGQRTPRVPPRDSSLHGSAAEHLRRYAAVYRCSERGGADQEGEFYRYGTAILNPDELLMRAQRHGWQAAP